MMRVIFAFLALQHRSAVLLGKTSHKSNDTDFRWEDDWRKWEYVVKTEIAPLASPNVNVTSTVAAKINHVIYVHRRSSHGLYYAHAFVNVDLDLFEKFILEDPEGNLKKKVKKAQSHLAGTELFQWVINDAMSELPYDKANLTQCVDVTQEYLTRTHTNFHTKTRTRTYTTEDEANADKDIRMVEFHDAEEGDLNQRCHSGTGGRHGQYDLFERLKGWGLHATGQMAFLQMVKKMEINKRLDMGAVPKALIETSNEFERRLYMFDKNETQTEQQIVGLLTEECQKARDSLKAPQ